MRKEPYPKADFNVEKAILCIRINFSSFLKNKNKCQREYKDNQLFSIQKQQSLRKEPNEYSEDKMLNRPDEEMEKGLSFSEPDNKEDV